MASQALTVQSIPGSGGAALTLSAANVGPGNGHNFVNDGRVYLLVQNPDAENAITIGVTSVPCSHGRSGDESKSVAAGETAIFGPFNKELFNNASGRVQVTPTGTAVGVLVAAFALP